MLTVREVLKEKGKDVWRVPSGAAVADALKLMAAKNVGAVLVMAGDEVKGIFSERDFARASAQRGADISSLPITGVMTRKVLNVDPGITIEECMALMTEWHIRHLPVLEDDRLVGLISIGDVVNKMIEDQKFSISQLTRYVSGGAY